MSDFDPVAYINEPRWRSSRLGLDRMHELLRLLGRPQDAMAFVHVAGTNGKGSTSTFIAAALQQAGYVTGLFTSPYIVEFADRIHVDGKQISADALLDVTLRVRAVAETMQDHPTEFELMCAVALLHFADCGCKIAVLETGLGGRLDATNVIDAPEVCVITPISFDHMEYLGTTLRAIATEKAGIIKRGCTVVCHPQEPDALQVVETCARNLECPLVIVDTTRITGDADDFSYDGFEHLSLAMKGSYQPGNAVVAIEALRALRARGWDIDDAAVRDGLAKAQCPGRFQLVAHDPDFIVDGGHNVQGAAVLVESLKQRYPDRRPVFILGVLQDKEYPEMLEQLMPLGQAFVCIQPPNSRALPASKLARAIRWTGQDLLGCSACVNPYVARDIPDAVRKARELAGEQGLVVAAGSLYSVADICNAARS